MEPGITGRSDSQTGGDSCILTQETLDENGTQSSVGGTKTKSGFSERTTKTGLIWARTWGVKQGRGRAVMRRWAPLADLGLLCRN